MPYNLIHEAWLPVRRAGGERLWVRPSGLTSDIANDPVVALDFPRPDWNAAITEFLIGLFTCALAPEDDRQWAVHWKAPPSPDELAEKLERLAFAFNLDGDGPRCFQEVDVGTEAKVKDVAKLLIDGPSTNALKNNTDHFNKRGITESLVYNEAAAALITLQTYAPYDSPKHVASIRSVGPLTTLITTSNGDAFWKLVWANVPPLLPDLIPPFDQDPRDGSWKRVFPWLGSTKAYGNGRKCGKDAGNHVLMPFFAMPRRVRLIFENKQNDVIVSCGSVRSFYSETFGPDYVGWTHPLSPYYDTKAGGRAPVKAEDGIAFYRDWLGVWGRCEKQYEAASLAAWSGRGPRVGLNRLRSLAITAFGFEFKQAQAVSWVESRVPFYAIDDEERRNEFYRTVRHLVGGADATANKLRDCIQIACYGVADSTGYSHQLSREVAEQVGREHAERFWRTTEARFREILDNLTQSSNPSDEDQSIRRDWLDYIRREAIRIFDDDIAPEEAWNDDPKRLIYARSQLTFAFRPTYHGEKKNPRGVVWDALGLNPLPKQDNVKKNGADA